MEFTTGPGDLGVLSATGQESDLGEEYEINPPPRVIPTEEITMDVAYRVLFCLQEDPEDVLFNGAEVTVPENPPISHVQAMVSILLQNEEEYEIAEMHPVEVKALITTLITYFIHACNER